MMAYGIAADDTMSIIDRFNAVGNNFAITSAGIGEAMQRSASALKEGGNTIDESIGLITGANAVIQDPLQVGELVAQQYSNILLENSYIG
jgi:TP901 family phage tail tape measure protein